MAQTKRSHVCTIPLRVRFSCQGLPHNDILPHHQHPQQRKHRPDSPQRVCQERNAERKNGNAFRFWHDAVLVFSRRSSPAAMLDSPLPTRRRGDIRLPSQAASDRDLRSVSRSRAVHYVAAGDSNTRPSTRSPVELDAATGWELRPGFSQSRQCPCGCAGYASKSHLIDPAMIPA